LVRLLSADLIEKLNRLESVNPAILSKLFKQMEVSGPRLSPPLIIRLDGAGFGKALAEAGFRQPRDKRVHEALLAVAGTIMARFSGSSAYVISDEVSVLLDSVIPYGGRLFKLVSIAAALASSILSVKLGHNLIMDCRPVLIPSARMWSTYVLWRSRVAANNYVSRLYHDLKRTRSTPSYSAMLAEVAEKIANKEEWEVLGSCLAYEVVEEVRMNPLTGEYVKKRRRIIERYDGPWSCTR
jgi:tRNA(His) 5'-end guanylyltransferase